MTVPIYCLNLARSVERRAHMEAEFARVGWTAQFIPALDGKTFLDRASMIQEGSLSRGSSSMFGPMSLAEMGCFMSHARAWRLLLETGQPAALICEDDIVFRDPQPSLNTLLRTMPRKIDLLYWTYLNPVDNPYIAAAFNPRKDKPAGRCDGYQIFRAWSCGGSACYLVTRQAAQTLLQHARPMRYPVDGYMGRLAFWHRLRHHALFPQAAEGAGFSSTIL